jgi:VanZ family protein
VTVYTRPFPSARTYAFLTLGVAVLTVYGSLVPFEFHARSFSDAVRAFEWVLQHRTRLESRSDGAANFLLGIPLGFCLLAAVRVDRPGRLAALMFAVMLLPACVAFSAAVEFSQLWFPNRTCALTDIEAQGLGAATGMAGWVLAGQRLTDWVRGIWDSDRYGGRVGRLILLYLLVLLTIQVLPFDVMTSPADIYRRLRDDRSLTAGPFGEWALLADRPAKQAEKMVAWLRLVGVFLPVGLLAARLPGVWRQWEGFPVVLGSAFLLGFGMEAAQIPILSRHASPTDVLLEAGAVVLGWVGAMTCRRGTGTGANVLFALGWTALLVAAGWYPFEFDPAAADRLTVWNLIPFAAIETSQYLMYLNVVMEGVVLYAPLGAAVAGMGPVGQSPWVGCLVAAGVAAGIEVGQIELAYRIPSTTDIVLAAIGGGVGADLWRRLGPSLGEGWTA